MCQEKGDCGLCAEFQLALGFLAATATRETCIFDGVSFDYPLPENLECFHLPNNFFPNPYTKMIQLETYMGQRTWTSLKEVRNLSLYLRSKGTFSRKVTTYKGAAAWAPAGLSSGHNYTA